MLHDYSQTNACFYIRYNLTQQKYCEELNIRMNLRINIYTDCSFADTFYFFPKKRKLKSMYKSGVYSVLFS